MSFGAALTSAGEAAAERQVTARIEHIARAVEALAIAMVAIERRRVVMRGAQLAKRRLSDPGLRFAAMVR